jgi:hypothetical protein
MPVIPATQEVKIEDHGWRVAQVKVITAYLKTKAKRAGEVA